MSNHSGKITFSFTGEPEGTTATGSVTHKASNFSDAVLKFDQLPLNFATPSITFGTETTSIDHWILDVTLSNGKKFSCDKDCAFYSEDQGGTVMTSLDIASNGSGTFNIKMPESSACSGGCN